MDLSADPVFIQVFFQQQRIAGGNSLSLEIIGDVFIIFIDRKCETAFPKTQLLYQFYFPGLFIQNILTYNPNICHSILNVLGDVIIAKEKYLQWKIIALC